jgi:hypothetical protein
MDHCNGTCWQCKRFVDVQHHCDACRKKGVDEKHRLKATIAKEKTKIGEIEGELNFLRLEAYENSADAPTKADVSIIVQSREDQVLSAHMFVLVGVYTIISLLSIRNCYLLMLPSKFIR